MGWGLFHGPGLWIVFILDFSEVRSCGRPPPGDDSKGAALRGTSLHYFSVEEAPHHQEALPSFPAANPKIE